MHAMLTKFANLRIYIVYWFMLFFFFCFAFNQFNVASVPHGFKEAMERVNVKPNQYQNTQTPEMDAKIPAGWNHKHTAFLADNCVVCFWEEE